MVQPPVQFSTVSNQDTYYSSSTALVVPAGTNVLPSDIYKIRGLDANIQQGRWLNCQRYEFESRNDFQMSDWSWPLQPLYEFQGSGNNAAIRFMPPPNGATPIKIWYYQNSPLLVIPTDSIDGGNGWEDYAVDYAAHYCAVKDENWELVAALETHMREIETRIKAEGANRNAGLGFKVRRSTRYKRTGWPWPGGGGWY